MRVCIDMNQKVVFFTPRGRAIFDAPPVRDRSMAAISPEPAADLGRDGRRDGGRDPGRDGGRDPGGSRTPDNGEPRQLRPYHLEGASRWTRDGEIPWAVEALAWEALDSG